MSMLGNIPSNAPFAAGYSAGPISGLPTSPDEKIAEGIILNRARNALILGVLSLPLGVLAGIPAIVVGSHALRLIRASGGVLRGRTIALCGVALGCLSILTTGAFLYWVQR